MKTYATILSVGAVLFLASCLSTPPTALEQKLFKVKTNLTEVAVPTMTNIVDGVPTVVPGLTSVVETYEYLPNDRQTVIQETGKVVGTFFGVGELVAAAIGGVFGLWGTLRSRKSNKTAAALIQVIETGKQLLQTTPQGQKLDEKWTTWMMKHQTEQGVITEVVRLMGQVVDTDSAKAVSQKILDLMKRDGA